MTSLESSDLNLKDTYSSFKDQFKIETNSQNKNFVNHPYMSGKGKHICFSIKTGAKSKNPKNHGYDVQGTFQ